MESNGFMIGPGIKEIGAIKVVLSTAGHPVVTLSRPKTVLAIAQREYVLCSCLSYENRENYSTECKSERPKTSNPYRTTDKEEPEAISWDSIGSFPSTCNNF